MPWAKKCHSSCGAMRPCVKESYLCEAQYVFKNSKIPWPRFARRDDCLGISSYVTFEWPKVTKSHRSRCFFIRFFQPDVPFTSVGWLWVHKRRVSGQKKLKNINRGFCFLNCHTPKRSVSEVYKKNSENSTDRAISRRDKNFSVQITTWIFGYSVKSL